MCTFFSSLSAENFITNLTGIKAAFITIRIKCLLKKALQIKRLITYTVQTNEPRGLVEKTIERPDLLVKNQVTRYALEYDELNQRHEY